MTQFNEHTEFTQIIRYKVTAIKPYKRKSDGKASKLVHWKMTCQGCGDSLTHKTPADAWFFTGKACRRCAATYTARQTETDTQTGRYVPPLINKGGRPPKTTLIPGKCRPGNVDRRKS